MSIERYEKFLIIISSALLIFVGIVGIVISIADFAGWDSLLLDTKEPLSLVLASIGILCISLGIERAIHFRRLNQDLKEMKELLSGSLGVQHLKSYQDVYNTSIRLCANAKSQVRYVIFVTSKPIKTPREWAEAVARRVRESKRTHSPIKLYPVLVLDFEKINEEYLEEFRERYNLYKRFGVIDLATPLLLDNKYLFGFDVFIIDREHLILAYMMYDRVGELQRGILFENNPKIASEFADWFDQIVLKSAIPLDEWLKNKYNIEIENWANS